MTSIYTIEAPNGKRYNIEGPAGADENDVLSFFQTEYEHPDFNLKVDALGSSYGEGRWGSFASTVQNVAGAALDWAGELVPEETAGRGRDYVREQTIDPLRDTYLSAAKANEFKALYTMPENGVANFATGTLDAFINMVPIMAVGGGLGYGLMGLEVGSKAYNDNIQRQKEAGVDPEEISRMRAAMDGVVKAAFEVVPEKIFGVLDNIGLASKGKELVKAQAKKIILGEGGSEALTEFFNMLYDKGMYDEGPDNVIDAVKQILYAAAQGVALGGGMAGVQYASNRNARKEQADLLAGAKEITDAVEADRSSQEATEQLRLDAYPAAREEAKSEMGYIDQLAGTYDNPRDPSPSSTRAGEEYGMLDQLTTPDLATTRPAELRPGSDEYALQQEEALAESIGQGFSDSRDRGWQKAYNAAVKRGEAKVAKMDNPSSADRFFTIQEELNMDAALKELSPTEQATWQAFEQQNIELGKQEDDAWRYLDEWQSTRPIRGEQIPLDLNQRPLKEGQSPLERDIADPPVIGPQSLYDIREDVGSMTDEEIVSEYERTEADPAKATKVASTYRNGTGIWGTPEYKDGLMDDMREAVLNNRIDQVKGLMGRQVGGHNLSSPELDERAPKSTRLSLESKKAKTSTEYVEPVIDKKHRDNASRLDQDSLGQAHRNKTGSWTVTGIDYATGRIDLEYRLHTPDKMGKETVLNYNWKIGDATINKTIVDGIWSAKWKHGSTKNKSENTKTHITPKLRSEIERMIRNTAGGETSKTTRVSPTAAFGTGKSRIEQQSSLQQEDNQRLLDEAIGQAIREATSAKGPAVKDTATPAEVKKEVARLIEDKAIKNLPWEMVDGEYMPDMRSPQGTAVVKLAVRNVQEAKEAKNKLTPKEEEEVRAQAKEEFAGRQGKMTEVLKERMVKPVRWGAVAPFKEDGDYDVPTYIEARDAQMIGSGVAGRARAYQVLPDGSIRVLEITPTEVGKNYSVRIVSQGRTKFKEVDDDGNPINLEVQRVGKPVTESAVRKKFNESRTTKLKKGAKLSPANIEIVMQAERGANKRRAADPGKVIRKGEKDAGTYDEIDQALEQDSTMQEEVYVPRDPEENRKQWERAARAMLEPGVQVEEETTPKEKRKTKNEQKMEQDDWLALNEMVEEQADSDGWLSLDDVRAEMDSIESGENQEADVLAEDRRMEYSREAELDLTIEEQDILDALSGEQRTSYLEELRNMAKGGKASAALKAHRYAIMMSMAQEAEADTLARAVAKVYAEDAVIETQILRIAKDVRQGILEIADGILEPYYRNTTAALEGGENEPKPMYIGDKMVMGSSGVQLTAVGWQQKHAARRALRDLIRDNPEVIIAVVKLKYTKPTDDISDADYRALVADANLAYRQIKDAVAEIKAWLISDPELATTSTMDSVKVHEAYKSSDPAMRNLRHAGRLPRTRSQVEMESLRQIGRNQRTGGQQELPGLLSLEDVSKDSESALHSFLTKWPLATRVHRDSNGRFIPAPPVEDVGLGRTIKSSSLEQKMALEEEMKRLTGVMDQGPNVPSEVAGKLEERLSAMEKAQVAERERIRLEKSEAEFEAVREERRQSKKTKQAARDALAAEMVALRKSIRNDEAAAARAEQRAFMRDLFEEVTVGQQDAARKRTADKMDAVDTLPELSDQAREEIALQAVYEEEADRYSDAVYSKKYANPDIRQMALAIDTQQHDDAGEWSDERRFADATPVYWSDTLDKATFRIVEDMVREAQAEYKGAQPKNSKPTAKNTPDIVDLNDPDPTGRAGFEMGTAMDGVRAKSYWEIVKGIGSRYFTKYGGLRGEQKNMIPLLDEQRGRVRVSVRGAMNSWARAAQQLKRHAEGYERYVDKWDGAVTDYLQDMQVSSIEKKWGVKIPQEAIKDLDAVKKHILDVATQGLENGAWSTDNVIGAVSNGRAYITKTAKSGWLTRGKIEKSKWELGKLAQVAWDIPTNPADLDSLSHAELLHLAQSDTLGFFSSHLAQKVVAGADGRSVHYRTIAMGGEVLILGKTNDKNTTDVTAHIKNTKEPTPEAASREQLIKFLSGHLPTTRDIANGMETNLLDLIQTKSGKARGSVKGANQSIQQARKLLLSDADFIAKASDTLALGLGKEGASIHEALMDQLPQNRKLSIEEFLMKAQQQYPQLRDNIVKKRAELELMLKIRETINELGDPESAIANTMQKVSESVETASLLQNIYHAGSQQGWIRHGTEDIGNSWAPLAAADTALGRSTFTLPNGQNIKGADLYAPREVADAMEVLSGTKMDIAKQNKLVGLGYAASSYTKWNAVIGNVEGLIRNFVSTGIIHTSRNMVGINSVWAHKLGSYVAAGDLIGSTSQMAQAAVSKANSAEVEWAWQEAGNRGLFFDGGQVGAIYDLQKKAVGVTTPKTKTYHRGKAGWSRGKSVLETTFRLGDEAVKLPAFLISTSEYLYNIGADPNLVKKAARGAELTTEETALLKRAMDNAAEVVKDSYPTFSRISAAMKAISRFPLAFSFPGFVAEMVRTSGHVVYDNLQIAVNGTMKDGTKIHKDKRAVASALAMFRASATVGSFYATGLLGKALFQSMWDDGDDEEGFFSDYWDSLQEDMKGLLQWYNKDSAGAAVINLDKQDRSFDVVNMDYGMPTGSIESQIVKLTSRIMKAMNEDDAPLAEELLKGMGEFILSFTGGTDPFYGSAYKRAQSTKIIPRNDDRLIKKLADGIDLALGGEASGPAGWVGAVGAAAVAAVPGAKLFDTAEKMYDAVREVHDEALANGDDELAAYAGKVLPWLMNASGMKTTHQTYERHLVPQMENQKRELSKRTSDMITGLGDPSIKTKEEFLAKFNALNYRRRQAFDEMHNTVSSTIKYLEVDPIEIEEELGDMAKSQITLSDINFGRYSPPTPEYFIDAIYDEDKLEEDPDAPQAATNAMTWQDAERLNGYYRWAIEGTQGDQYR